MPLYWPLQTFLQLQDLSLRTLICMVTKYPIDYFGVLIRYTT